MNQEIKRLTELAEKGRCSTSCTFCEYGSSIFKEKKNGINRIKKIQQKDVVFCDLIEEEIWVPGSPKLHLLKKWKEKAKNKIRQIISSKKE